MTARRRPLRRAAARPRPRRRGARPVRADWHRVGGRLRRCCSTSCRAPSATTSSTSCARPRRHPRPLAPVDRPNRPVRWLAGLPPAGQPSNRYGKIGHGRRPRRRPADGAPSTPAVLPDRRSARPEPGLRRLRGHPRDHRGQPATAPGVWPRAPRRLGLRVVRRRPRRRRRILRRGGRPAVLRPTTPSSPTGTWHRRRPPRGARDGRGDPAVVDGSWAVVAEGCAGADPLDEALVETWMGHRNDVSALERLISGGLVVDTMEISGRGRPCPRSTSRPSPPSGASRALAASAHQSHAVPRRRLPLLHLRRQARPEAKDDFLPGRGTPGPGRCPGPRRSLSHHHGSASTGPGSSKEALGEGLRRARRPTQGALGPERHPQPRQAGPALALRVRPGLVSGTIRR